MQWNDLAGAAASMVHQYWNDTKKEQYNGWRQNQGQLELFKVGLCDVLIYIQCNTLIDGSQHTLNFKNNIF